MPVKYDPIRHFQNKCDIVEEPNSSTPPFPPDTVIAKRGGGLFSFVPVLVLLLVLQHIFFSTEVHASNPIIPETSIVGTQTLKKLAIFHACIHCHKNPPTSNKSTHFNTCTHIYILQLQES